VIEYTLRGCDPHASILPDLDQHAHGGVFVTLRKFGHLRGCMGTLDSSRPLADAVVDAAVSAAVRDPRFPPLALRELPDVRITVSILSAPRPLPGVQHLELGRHGILVRRGGRSGLFLPQVATEHGFDRETFLSRCCSEKAGLMPDAWRDPETELLCFTADIYEDE